jgi:two-component system, cell cycle sensor histidine kinase and response regulator CckA
MELGADLRIHMLGQPMPSPSTVLVVDDDELSRALLYKLLAMENYTVILAKTGAQALEIATRITPDVVLLDVVMPDLDGFEVCRKIRANPALRQIPIILLTALEGRGSRLRGLAAGADEFLSKPVDPIELRTRVRTITGLNRFRQICDERARFETAIAHSPDAIGLTDRDGRLLHTNPAFEHLVGKAPALIVDCFPEAAAEIVRSHLAKRHTASRKIEGFETPLALCRSAGAIADVTMVRLPPSEGVAFQFVLRDITERKQLENQLLRLQRIELLGQVAGGVVHDVNNLLTAVIGNAEVLERSAEGHSRSQLVAIRQSAEHGATLLRRILMFARGTDQQLIPFCVSAILHETAGMASKLLDEKIKVTVDTPANLPNILGDASQLHQVVMNLCVNARDAMPSGGRLQLSAAATKLTAEQARAIGPDASPGEFVAIRVHDTGTGIPVEIRDRLFDPFFTTKPREVATGLGLATVLRVVRRHHGFIGMETAVGQGTCFTVFIPAIAAPKPALAHAD